MADAPAGGVLVIGVGNELRSDDGAGIAVARRLRESGVPRGVEVLEEQGEPVGLLDRWRAHDAVLLVDTMRSGAAPGTLRRLDVTAEPLRGGLPATASTHAISLRDTIELARALDRLPPRIVVHAVEGRRFDAGAELSAEIEAVVPALAAAVLRDARRFARSTKRGRRVPDAPPPIG